LPHLQNERHELYALHRARGFVPKRAAACAGFATGSSIYTSLEADADVMNRIMELSQVVQMQKEQNRAAAIEAARTVGHITGMNKAWVLEQLALNVVAARDDGQIKESNDALKMIGDEFGMWKGTSGVDEVNGEGRMLIDLDKTDALLNSADHAMTVIPPTPDEEPVIDMAIVERLIAGNKPIKIKERQLSTGSETDVAMTAESEIPNVEIPPEEIPDEAPTRSPSTKNSPPES